MVRDNSNRIIGGLLLVIAIIALVAVLNTDVLFDITGIGGEETLFVYEDVTCTTQSQCVDFLKEEGGITDDELSKLKVSCDQVCIAEVIQ